MRILFGPKTRSYLDAQQRLCARFRRSEIPSVEDVYGDAARGDESAWPASTRRLMAREVEGSAASGSWLGSGKSKLVGRIPARAGRRNLGRDNSAPIESLYAAFLRLLRSRSARATRSESLAVPTVRSPTLIRSGYRMSWYSKVFWSEGLFLRPHHLQQNDRYLEHLIEKRVRHATPYPWGFAATRNRSGPRRSRASSRCAAPPA